MRSDAEVKVHSIQRMELGLSFACLLALAALCCADKKNGLQIGVKKRPETCDMRSKKGDKLSMHYTVSTKNQGMKCISIVRFHTG